MTSSVESEPWAATESFYGRVLEDDTLRPFFKENRYGGAHVSRGALSRKGVISSRSCSIIYCRRTKHG
jgi:hypothetical protein